MHYKTKEMKSKTEIGKWLCKKMMKQNLTCADAANKLHVTRQTVAFHANGHHVPNYPSVIHIVRYLVMIRKKFGKWST